MPAPARDSGYTLIEVLVTISLMGALMAIAVIGFDKWSQASEQSGTARELQSLLRQTQQRAVTEGQSLCVSIEPHSYTVWRRTCTSGVKVEGPVATNGSGVSLSGDDEITFRSRGTADPATVDVAREGSDKTYTLTVTQLTGRVDLDGA